MTLQVAAGHADPLKGIGLKVCSVTIFVAMSSCLKAAGELPAGQLVFYRSCFAMAPVLLLLAWRGDLRYALQTGRPFNHVARGLVGVLSMSLSFFALTRLPLPESVTLNYAQPLLVVVFSALFLHETIRVYRWSAVAVGMVGVLIISWPTLTLFTELGAMSSGQVLGVAAALAGATVSAVALLLVRSLVLTERSSTIVLWFFMTATLLSLASYPLGWQPLTWTQTAFLVSAGICGGVAQLLMTECYRYAEASTVAPFEYTSMILSIVVGYLAFGDVPTLYTLVGGIIVVGAGLFIIFREHRLGIERAAARKVAAPQ